MSTVKNIYFIAIFLFSMGCTRSQTLLEDLMIKDNRFYLDSSKVYSGYAITKFESGKVSNQIFIEDGIPSGQWIAYGYDGEVVQKGKYKPAIGPFEQIEGLKNIHRINICETKEATVNFIDIFIVSGDQKIDVDKTEDKKFRDALLKELKRRNTPIAPELVHKITIGAMELK